MPRDEGKRYVQSLKILVEQVIMYTRAHNLDYEFLKLVTSLANTPEFGGFNIRKARERGQSLRPSTTTMYTPLIDVVPSDPDTMMTAMCEAQRLTVKCGQTYTIFTAESAIIPNHGKCYVGTSRVIS